MIPRNIHARMALIPGRELRVRLALQRLQRRVPRIEGDDGREAVFAVAREKELSEAGGGGADAEEEDGGGGPGLEVVVPEVGEEGEGEGVGAGGGGGEEGGGGLVALDGGQGFD